MATTDAPTFGSREIRSEGGRHTALVDQIDVFAAAVARDRSPRLIDLVLDGVGVAIAGRTSHGAQAAAGVLGGATASWDSAWLHGMQMHSLDFDDTHEPSLCHSGTALLPGLLALGRAQGRSGRELLEAFDLGIRFVDFASECGAGLNAAGAHSTAILGSLASAAACAWLTTRDAAVAADAVELAALLAAGLGAAFGSDGKPLQAARASEVGVRAALFAAGGLNAPRGAAFGEHGVLALWLGIDALDSVRWGDECSGAAARVAIKPYPSCFLTHSTIDGVLALRESLDLRRATELERMTVEVHPLAGMIADKTTLGAENAKFSLRYCALAALSDGRVNVETFGPAGQQRLVDEAGTFERWVGRVEVRTDAAAPTLISRIGLLTTDGRERSVIVEAPRGSRTEPLSREDVITKFRDNAARQCDDAAVQLLVDIVLALPSAPDIGALEPLTLASTCAAAPLNPAGV
jgi:2-methylcitrate dehydratase PrpD